MWNRQDDHEWDPVWVTYDEGVSNLCRDTWSDFLILACGGNFHPAPIGVVQAGLTEMEPSTTSAGHVFICYAREDQDFVLSLAGKLKERSVPVWLDLWDISPSEDWDIAIDNALYACTHFVIVLSPAAVASREVRGELHTALRADKPIVPVLYKAGRIPRQLLTIQYCDFSSHGVDDQAAMGQLLYALGVSEARRLFEPEVVLIPAGEFLMGSDPDKDKDANENEQPQHKLYLPDYYIAKAPVANAQYAAFMKATGHGAPKHWKGGKPPKGKEDHPVVNVDWHDAAAYCEWLAETNGKPYRLPSEAEWEKAARGTDGRIYPWGDEWDANRCNSKKGGRRNTTPVCQYSPGGDSPYGCADMAGNVWEWTRCLWGTERSAPAFKYPYDPTDGREDLEAGDEVRRVLRGGSFLSTGRGVRCAYRLRIDPLGGFNLIGFRIVIAPGYAYGL